MILHVTYKAHGGGDACELYQSDKFTIGPATGDNIVSNVMWKGGVKEVFSFEDARITTDSGTLLRVINNPDYC